MWNFRCQLEEVLESSCFQRRAQRQVESSEYRGASVGSVKSAFTTYWLPLYLLKFPGYTLPLAQVIIDEKSLGNDVSEIFEAVTSCSEKQGISKLKILDLLSKDEIPETEELITFYDCFGTTLNLYDDNGNVKYHEILIRYPEYVNKRLGFNVTDSMIVDTIGFCSKVNASSNALRAIKKRNCALSYGKSKYGRQ
ncbi:hypothetical protein FQA39_LY13768 [Lamprigera yunnana]|nr:hypothetical protein FQA39_LY13768 [Lamprigera yunnana]